MANRCVACEGMGSFWAEMACPLCEGVPWWPEAGEMEEAQQENEGEIESARRANEGFPTNVSVVDPVDVPENPYGDAPEIYDLSEDHSDALDSHAMEIEEPSQTNADESHDASVAVEEPEVEETDTLPSDSSPRLGFQTSNVFMMMGPGGFLQLTVLIPGPARPKLTEEEVANIGTTWTHGSSTEVPPNAAARKTLGRGTCGDREHADVHHSCGICLQEFDEGEKLTCLPCVDRGCSSVWHLSCMHNWLNQGQAPPSCPLCRAEVACPASSDTDSSAPTILTTQSFGFMGDEGGRASPFFLQEPMMSALFRGFLARGLSSSLHADTPAMLSEEDLTTPMEHHAEINTSSSTALS